MSEKSAIAGIKLRARTPATLPLPPDAQVVAVGRDPHDLDDPGALVVWYRFTLPEASGPSPVQLFAVLDGEPFPAEAIHLGAVQADPFTWHVLALRK